MNILIVCVNFNSYKELKSFINSINEATCGVGEITVDVFIADNSNDKERVIVTPYDKVNIKQFNYENLGYLGGASAVINDLPNVLDYDFVAISNVDLQISKDFFKVLNNIELSNDIAWIAPQIYSHEEKRDINPKVMNRYSKKKLKMLYYMYKYPVLFYLYFLTAYRRKRIIPTHNEMDIYAGHGSFMLLTRNFFKEYKKIEYPIFLFGEELFLAELIRNKGMKVRYMPSLRIEDNEHVSTSRMKKKFYFKCNTESIKYILDTFYE